MDEYIWPSGDICTAWAPVLQRPVPLSCRIYADDTSETHVVGSAVNAQCTLDAAHQRLRECLAEGGYEHNADKSRVSPVFAGKGSLGFRGRSSEAPSPS
eukprot:3041583-Pyramimonas_sp.AAC.1